MEVSNDFLIALYVFGAIGVLYCAVVVLKFIYFFCRLCHLYWMPLSKTKLRAKFQRYGKWAVVTGSTDGIGKEYALQLAAAGMNIVLISRTEEKLKKVATEIEHSYKVETKTIPFDFAQSLNYDRIRAGLKDLDIGVVVNNVGMDHRYPMRFNEVPESDIVRILNCNTLSLIQMSHIVLPIMLQNRRGLIINVGSTGSLAPMPMIAEYVSTKCFLDAFSQSLALEYSQFGIDVQTLLPGLVATKLSGAPHSNLLIKTPRDFVSSALLSAGRSRWCHGCTIHELQGAFMSWLLPLLPFHLKRSIFEKEMGKIRERKLLLESNNRPASPVANTSANEHRELLTDATSSA